MNPPTQRQCAERRPSSGVLLAVLELSAELEPVQEQVEVGSSSWFAPGRSSGLLESLRRDWPRADGQAPPVPAASAGRQLGRYRLIERVGRGSQAEVWKAIRIEPELEMVALKVLSPELARDPVRRDRLRREAELGSWLGSPALLPTHEFGEFEGSMYLAMPLVHGHSLDAVIMHRRLRVDVGHGGGPPAWWSSLSPEAYVRAIAGVLARIGRTLQLVHQRGVVHRDIKPANILLDRHVEDHAFLCDFGLGRELDGQERTLGEDGAGTPLYMAPEKLAGGEVDEVRCDIYALGMTLFEASTLVHPFPVPKLIPQSCLAAYLATVSPPRPRAVQPRLSRSLESIILKATARDPARRYSEAADFVADLERFLSVAPARRFFGKVVRSDQPVPQRSAAIASALA